MTAMEFISTLDGVRARGAGKWSAKCPVHEDKSPSLSIREGADRILLHCFALCETRDIVAAVGLTMADLFCDVPPTHGQRSLPRPAKLDRVAVAWRFELAALDRRSRAERIVEAGKRLDVVNLSDAELDRALNYVAQAVADVEQAEHFEHVADTLRMRAFHERDHEQKRPAA
jgi:hypothetical protein